MSPSEGGAPGSREWFSLSGSQLLPLNFCFNQRSKIFLSITKVLDNVVLGRLAEAAKANLKRHTESFFLGFLVETASRLEGVHIGLEGGRHRILDPARDFGQDIGDGLGLNTGNQTVRGFLDDFDKHRRHNGDRCTQDCEQEIGKVSDLSQQEDGSFAEISAEIDNELRPEFSSTQHFLSDQEQFYHAFLHHLFLLDTTQNDSPVALSLTLHTDSTAPVPLKGNLLAFRL